MSIPQTFVQELLARADVVEIVGRYVQLKKGGANFMGLCPFHGEKSPSFSVSPSKQFYHCFGCGKSGDAISFLMEHAGMSFVEAVQDLAQQYGLQVPEDDASPQDRARALAQRQKQSTLNSVLEKAADAYKKQLKESPRAVDYLKGRGLSGEIAKQFGLGYAPEGWRSLASVFANYDEPLLVESGLVILNVDEASGEEKRYDRFRDRIMFPIRNIKGECIGFGGRVLGDDKPKYLNSPETPVFSKGRELYGLFEARSALNDQGYALVTEGYMDVVALAQLGFSNAVATLGTACTAEHLHKLFRFTDAVVFSFDGDAAGRRAARKALDGALPFATDVRSVKFLFLPPEHDPDSFIREFGKEAFARYVSEAVPLSRFLIDAAREGCDLNTAEGRAHFASNAKPLWQLLPEGALKLQMLSEIADLVQLSARELTEVWHPAVAGKSGGKSNKYEKHSESRNEYVGYSQNSSKKQATRPRLSGRARPISRADYAARLLLGDMAALEDLSAEDHSLLCDLPEPHGPLFVWLENQLHEHGPQAWVALREGLRGRAEEELALRLMSDYELADPLQSDEASNELRDLLNRMLVEKLKVQETEAIQAAKADPGALQRYRELQARRFKLESLPVRAE
ncbi:MAG: DNA primase [Gammaproteobacteria bacterium]|uniref:DNA primase n=1 Tax=Rhodoferax sp. TaxID=50421 RepID=UPI0018471191|nr:DNA primase [Rhodoferax sp.]MBU3899525.1 DNA primase [Gammaproteobacteria bacterium]MBA3059595.1 DNA primase [Rhodoferax sp.]MBU3998180.1 DNA primase [Gammaproteobacteria bacterium]MBU4018001.1 DNA primase [Gammaproteobacteria bacterium]MBU4080308.1 DNA primase [Gammaproteobacteria bacterium]